MKNKRIIHNARIYNDIIQIVKEYSDKILSECEKIFNNSDLLFRDKEILSTLMFTIRMNALSRAECYDDKDFKSNNLSYNAPNSFLIKGKSHFLTLQNIIIEMEEQIKERESRYISVRGR